MSRKERKRYSPEQRRRARIMRKAGFPDNDQELRECGFVKEPKWDAFLRWRAERNGVT